MRVIGFITVNRTTSDGSKKPIDLRVEQVAQIRGPGRENCKPYNAVITTPIGERVHTTDTQEEIRSKISAAYRRMDAVRR